MFSRESRKTWSAVYLIGLSAFLFMLYIVLPNAPWHNLTIWSALAAAIVGLWLSVSKAPLNRTLGNIHNDLRSGEQAISTPLQKLCTLLGIALITVICIRTVI